MTIRFSTVTCDLWPATRDLWPVTCGLDPPAFFHLGRENRTKVPQVQPRMSTALSSALQSTKAYADKRNRASPPDVKGGDKVLLRQAKQNKLSTPYDPNPYTVLERKGPRFILQPKKRSCVLAKSYHMYATWTRTLLFIQEEEDYEVDEDLPQTVLDDMSVLDEHLRIWVTFSYKNQNWHC